MIFGSRALNSKQGSIKIGGIPIHLWGLHIIDAILIGLYFFLILWVGKRLHKRMTTSDEYFLAGRRMGKLYQFFLNFGSSTDAWHATAVSREIYRQGIAGMWIQYLVLFLTPFYWFTTLLFRRARLITIGDLFVERFQSKFLGGAYAVFMIIVTLFGVAVGYVVSAKTFMALTPKPESAYTVSELRSVQQFEEFRELRQLYSEGKLDPAQRERFQQLQSLDSRGELKAFISYVNPVVFYFIFGGFVCIYVILGGFAAAAITDTLQGILLILFSCLLIPFGLLAVGGFKGLHASVPEHMFWLFGTDTLSDYAWYTIAAMAFANLVSIVAVISNMQTSGSARNEAIARFGMIGGTMFKRLMMIFWALAGLIAIALFSGELNDPDLIWGYMTRELLGPGLIGVMMVGVLAASMSTLDTQSVAMSALFVNQVYKPLVAGKSERHYLAVGKIVIVALIFGGIGMAIYVTNLLELIKYIISIPAIFGAAIWLGFIWRRVTPAAVTIQVFIAFAVIVVVPNVFQVWEKARLHPSFLQQTHERQVVVSARALQADVEQGLARRVGERIEKPRVLPASAIFFDSIARQHPEDPDSPLMGYGRFHAELWILSWFGLDFTDFTRAQLIATRFAFDALFPLLLLVLLSYFTRPVDVKILNYFFAKIHTPVQTTPELDAWAIETSLRNLPQLESRKLFPRTGLEIHRPMKADYIGFLGTWVLVGLVILLLWVMVNVGA